MIKSLTPAYLIALSGSVLIITMMLLLFLRERKNAAEMRLLETIWLRFIGAYDEGKSVEQVLSDLLAVVSELLPAPGYYFYTIDRKGENFTLRAARNILPGDPAGPSYAGLAPYRRDAYPPPLGLPLSAMPAAAALKKEGELGIIFVPLAQGMCEYGPKKDPDKNGDKPAGLITIGPVKRINNKTLGRLNRVGKGLAPFLRMMLEHYNMREKFQSLYATSRAVNMITRSTVESDGGIKTFFELGVKLAGASGGVLMVGRDKELNFEMAAWEGLDEVTFRTFRKDYDAHQNFFKVLCRERIKLLQPGTPEYSLVPQYLKERRSGCHALFHLGLKSHPGFAVLFVDKGNSFEPHRLSSVDLFIRRIGDVVRNQQSFKVMSRSYQDTLKTLVAAMDTREPFSVGHSDRVAKYSGAIAESLGLAPPVVDIIGLAGYLHDIGMCCLEDNIFFKLGKFTNQEYETMKLHSQIGAELVKSFGLPWEVLLYIRHHHERWDGWGYPHGLKKEEIPLGARIITVADTFNAKITSRDYRTAVNFNRALADIKDAAGTQLDPLSVQAFLKYFEKKRSLPAAWGRSLEPCWEMKCCPEALSATCPAYGKKEKCWEIGGVKCDFHGDTCANCFVYTEFHGRLEKPALV